MGVLNFNEMNQTIASGDNLPPFSKMYIYAAGTDVLLPVFQDNHLTEMQANPVTADDFGHFDICYLVNGTYRIVVRGSDGQMVLDKDNVSIRTELESGIVRSFTRVDDMLANRSLSYRAGRGLQAVQPDELVYVSKGDFSYQIAPETATDHHLQTAGGLKFYVRDKNGVISLEAFGADPYGKKDSAPQLQAALVAVRQKNLERIYRLDGAGGLTDPRCILELGAGTYLLSTTVEFDNLGAIEVCGRAAVLTGDFDDYLLRFTGRCMNFLFRGIVFESTRKGCVEFTSTNLSSARVQFVDCRFVTDPDKYDASIGVKYHNRSSTLSFESCYFNRIKHPIHVTSCDFITFYDCWFGFPTFAAFDDRDGYIRCEKGFLDINRCLFAGGPSWYNTKTYRDGTPMPGYSEVAYIKMGVEAEIIANQQPGVAPTKNAFLWRASANGNNEYYLQDGAGGDPYIAAPINISENGAWIAEGTQGLLSSGEWAYGDNDDLGYSTLYIRLSDDTDPKLKPDGYLRMNHGAHAVDNGRVSISDTRIGYEVGAGPLINWFIANKGGAGTDFRGGIVLRNIQTGPREEKQLIVNGQTAVAPLLRLFEMPHQIILDGIHGNAGHLGLIAAGSTTSLPALRAVAHQPTDHKTDFALQMQPDAHGAYSLRDITTLNLHMTMSENGPTETENARWMELFGAFDYFFPSDFTLDSSAGNARLVTVRTFFSDFSGDRRGCIFEVSGGARGSIANGSNGELPIFGYLTVVRDETGTDTLFAKFRSAVDTSDTNPEVLVTAKFDVSGTTSTSIPVSNAASATLVVELEHENNPGVGNVRCAGLIVKPVSNRFAHARGIHLRQSYS